MKTSPFKQHLKTYGNGCGSDECKGANVCLARGSIPADILMIGEAPGISEAQIGIPFCGPAGHLLDDIISRSYDHLPKEKQPRICITNVVGCIPLDDEGEKISTPTVEQIVSCKPRLQELALIADGKNLKGRNDTNYLKKTGTLRAVVAIGNEAQSVIDPKFKSSASVHFHRVIPQYHIIHPAAILRKSIAFRDLEIQRCIVTLVNLWIDVIKEGEKLSV